MRVKFVCILIFFVFLNLGCHRSHHSTSKEKYKELTKKNSVLVEEKEIFDRTAFVHWGEESEEKFLIKKAWSDAKVQSCKRCHDGYSLNKMKGNKFRKAHWDIRLIHGDKHTMRCTTCHNKNQVWSLNFGDQRVSVNRAPKLCIQCHFQQGKSWEIGAHGKRASGWQFQKAVGSCVSCHNSHRPAFEKRWPKLAPYRPINNEER